MLVAERHRAIVNLVAQIGSVRVAELARRFRVTEETIRRDLEKLKSEGKLERSHGGAVSVGAGHAEVPLASREISQVEEKLLIAQTAIQHIAEGDTILLDASTTAFKIAQLLPDVPLTVLTNSISTALELATRPLIRVVMCGGQLLSSSLSFIGPQAERFLAEYHVDKLFFSCSGVDFHRGLSDSNEWQANMKKRMIEISDTRFLLVDNSKFHVNALTVFGTLHDIDTVITDCHTGKEIIHQLEESGVGDVYVVGHK